MAVLGADGSGETDKYIYVSIYIINIEDTHERWRFLILSSLIIISEWMKEGRKERIAEGKRKGNKKEN